MTDHCVSESFYVQRWGSGANSESLHALHIRQGRRNWGGDRRASQILADQLSQLGGGHIIPTTLLFIPRIFKPSHGPSRVIPVVFVVMHT